MAYQTIYDLEAYGFHGWPFLVATFALAFGALGLMARARLNGANPLAARSLFVFSILFADFSIAMPYLEYSRLTAALAHGEAQVANGFISHHEVRPRVQFGQLAIGKLTGELQSFSVNGVNFDWAFSGLGTGLLGGADQALALRDGQVLRVTYVEDGEGSFKQRRILRLEVADATADTSIARL
ncbi:MAG TPA: hypothetical protein VFM46_18935 [Pseudomonadales bacterium]|nr:hypothetical protein [Pseudomonadales bacterium]